MKNDWIKIKNYYLTHEISLEALSKKFKVSITTAKKHCREENWVEEKKKKRTEIDQKVNQKSTEREINRKVKANEIHTELFSKGLRVAELLLNQYLADLEAGKKKTKATAYNLDFIMKAIANAQKGQRLSLNIEAEESGDGNEPQVAVIKGLDLDKI